MTQFCHLKRDIFNNELINLEEAYLKSLRGVGDFK